MKTITINILAEDIRTTKFHKGQDCAITRALKHAGIDARHTGFSIQHNTEFGSFSNPGDLAERVIGMYKFLNPSEIYGFNEWKAEPADFSFELEVPDNWVETPQGRYVDGGNGFVG